MHLWCLCDSVCVYVYHVSGTEVFFSFFFMLITSSLPHHPTNRKILFHNCSPFFAILLSSVSPLLSSSLHFSVPFLLSFSCPFLTYPLLYLLLLSSIPSVSPPSHLFLTSFSFFRYSQSVLKQVTDQRTDRQPCSVRLGQKKSEHWQIRYTCMHGRIDGCVDRWIDGMDAWMDDV